MRRPRFPATLASARWWAATRTRSSAPACAGARIAASAASPRRWTSEPVARGPGAIVNERIETIPVLTDVVEDTDRGATPATDPTVAFLEELESHLTAT